MRGLLFPTDDKVCDIIVVVWPLHLLQSYAVVGLIGELVKYMLIRRVNRKPVAVSPYAVLVYSACCGAVFGLVENLLVVILSGLSMVSWRASWSVPFHVGTALAMGLTVAQPRGGERW